MGTDTRQSAEDQFRGELKDAAVLIAKLEPYCKTIEELLSVVNLAVENDGQLRLLMPLVLGKTK